MLDNNLYFGTIKKNILIGIKAKKNLINNAPKNVCSVIVNPLTREKIKNSKL